MPVMRGIKTSVERDGRLRFDAASLGGDLSTWLAGLFPGGEPALTSCRVTSADDRSVRIEGTSTTLVPGVAVRADAVIFETGDPARPACLLWLDVDREALDVGAEPSFVESYLCSFPGRGRAEAAIELIAPGTGCLVSSVACGGTHEAHPVPYPADWRYPREEVLAGANFVGSLDPEFAGAVGEMLGGDHLAMPAHGLVRDARLEVRWKPRSTVEHTFGQVRIAFTGLFFRTTLDPDEDPEPSVTAAGDGAIHERTVAVGAARDPQGHADPGEAPGSTLGATGEVTIDGQPFAVGAAFDPYGHAVRLSVTTPLTLNAVLPTLVGSTTGEADAQTPWDDFRTFFAGQMTSPLASLWLDVAWEEDAPAGVTEIGLALEATAPLVLVPGWVSIQPKLDMRVVRPFEPEGRSLEGTVRGRWILGARVELDTVMEFPSGEFSVTLAQGSTLDSDVVAKRFGLERILPKVTIETLELSGNAFQRSFVATLGAHGSSHELGEGLMLSQLALEVAYQPGDDRPDEPDDRQPDGGRPGDRQPDDHEPGGPDREDDAARLSYSLEAVLTWKGHVFDVLAEHDDGEWALSGAYCTESVGLRQIAGDLGVVLPDEGETITLTSVGISARSAKAGYALALEGSTSGTFSVGGVKLGVEYFGASIEKREHLTVTGRLIVSVTISGPVTVRLVGERREKGWHFEGSTGPGQQIPLGRVIEYLLDLVSEIAVPSVIANFTVEDLGVTIDTGTGDTGTGEFRFSCKGQFPVDRADTGPKVSMVVIVTVREGKATFKGSLAVTVAGRLLPPFHVTFDMESVEKVSRAGSSHPAPGARTSWVATLSAERDGLTMRDLLAAIGASAPDVGALDVPVTAATFAYTRGGEPQETKFLVGVGVGGFRLPDVPLVERLAPGQALAVEHLDVLVASRPFRVAEIDALNLLLPADRSLAIGRSDGPEAIALRAGVSVTAMVRLGDTTQVLTLPEAGGREEPGSRGSGESATRTSGGATPPAGSDATEAPGAVRKWLVVEKTFGPLAIHRVGGEWSSKEGRLGVLLDAGVDLFGLQVGLTGLRVSLPVKDPDPGKLRFALDGLDLAFRSGPVEVSGGLLRVRTDDGHFEYTGAALIKTEAFSVSGFGSYTAVGSAPSLFIYALLDRDLGGPPCFHVTGLAAGFGFNRALTIPEVDKVQEFPLIRAAMHPDESRDFGAMSRDMARSIPAAPGEYWLAAGVRFTSFQMVESFALVALRFGTETVITGLGLSCLTAPPAPRVKGAAAPAPPETIARVEVALKIAFRPDSGILTMEARLTPASYVFSEDCHLSGGFAFYAWFKDVPRPGKPKPIPAGDFVVTLGGYHPKFTAPEHYPVVPRLALDWQVSRKLRVAGEVYFALTPTCLMAGGRLSAVFQDGPLRAWFDAYAHFFVAWEPVHYTASAGIRIGVSYRLSKFGITVPLSVEMSASVQFWGPPFAGTAEIHWTVISFTVYFGESRKKPPPKAPLEWPVFARSFLPRSATGDGADPLTIAVVRGVIAGVEARVGDDTRYVLVNPHQATVVIRSAVPCTSLTVNGTPLPAPAPTLGIPPMGIATLGASPMVVEVRHKGDLVTLTTTAVVQNVPAALWGRKPLDREAPQEVELVDKALIGVELGIPAPGPGRAYPPEDLRQRWDRSFPSLDWRYDEAVADRTYEPEAVVEHLTSSRTDVEGAGNDVRPVRGRLLDALVHARLVEDTARDVDDAYRDMQLQAPPVECGLGMLPLIPADWP